MIDRSVVDGPNNCFHENALYSRGCKKSHPAIKKIGPGGGSKFYPNESKNARKILCKIVKSRL